jgi:hypothetical protein
MLSLLALDYQYNSAHYLIGVLSMDPITVALLSLYAAGYLSTAAVTFVVRKSTEYPKVFLTASLLINLAWPVLYPVGCVIAAHAYRRGLTK